MSPGDLPSELDSPDAARRPRVAVVGSGHWLLSHDAVGPRVLTLLEGRYGPEVALCEAGTGGLDVLDHVDGQELLLVVDACTMGGPPGEIRCVGPQQMGDAAPVVSAHQIGPLEALAVARKLFPERLPRRTLLLLVETEGLTEEGLEPVCQQVVSIIDDEIRRALEGGHPSTGERARATPAPRTLTKDPERREPGMGDSHG